MTTIAFTTALDRVAEKPSVSFPSFTTTSLVTTWAAFLPTVANRSRSFTIVEPSAVAENTRRPVAVWYVSAMPNLTVYVPLAGTATE